jgi:hypothetical protein
VDVHCCLMRMSDVIGLRKKGYVDLTCVLIWWCHVHAIDQRQVFCLERCLVKSRRPYLPTCVQDRCTVHILLDHACTYTSVESRTFVQRTHARRAYPHA